MEMGFPYMETDQNFQLKYLRKDTQKLSKISTAAITHQDL